MAERPHKICLFGPGEFCCPDIATVIDHCGFYNGKRKLACYYCGREFWEVKNEAGHYVMYEGEGEPHAHDNT